jgi:hypothetical protein
MKNNSQATTSSNTIARSNKQEEITSYSATHTGTSYHQLCKWQKSKQEQSSKETATDCNYVTITSTLSVLTLLHSCFIMPD